MLRILQVNLKTSPTSYTFNDEICPDTNKACSSLPYPILYYLTETTVPGASLTTPPSRAGMLVVA